MLHAPGPAFPGSSPGWSHKKKEAHLRLLIMLGYPDSNQERQDQNLQCYHYTIAQYLSLKSGAKILLFCITQTFWHNFCHCTIWKRPSLLFLQIKNKFKVIWMAKKKKRESIVESIIEGIQERKGEGITVVDLTGIEDTVCRYFVILTRAIQFSKSMRLASTESLGLSTRAISESLQLKVSVQTYRHTM